MPDLKKLLQYDFRTPGKNKQRKAGPKTKGCVAFFVLFNDASDKKNKQKTDSFEFMLLPSMH